MSHWTDWLWGLGTIALAIALTYLVAHLLGLI